MRGSPAVIAAARHPPARHPLAADACTARWGCDVLKLCAQLERELHEARSELTRLTIDRTEVVAQAQRRQGSANPSVLQAYREGFSDGTQDSKPPAHPPGTTAAPRTRRSAPPTRPPLPLQLWMREDLVFGDAALCAAALSPSSRSMPIYIPSARTGHPAGTIFMHTA